MDVAQLYWMINGGCCAVLVNVKLWTLHCFSGCYTTMDVTQWILRSGCYTVLVNDTAWMVRTAWMLHSGCEPVDVTQWM